MLGRCRSSRFRTRSSRSACIRCSIAPLVGVDGERIGLIGRNGTGKSSLLGVIAGTLALDDGEVQRRDGLRIVPRRAGARAARRADAAREPSACAAASSASPTSASAGASRRGWSSTCTASASTTRRRRRACSGGERKRAALALALALRAGPAAARRADQPPRHRRHRVAGGAAAAEPRRVLFVTHDRAFLDRVATRIVELDRGMLRSYPGNYAAYRAAQGRRARRRGGGATASSTSSGAGGGLDPQGRRGAPHAQRGPRARARGAARRARGAARAAAATSRLALDAGERSGKLVAEVEGRHASASATRTIVRDLDLRILRGDRIGLVGPNGAGKTTLLKLLLGELAPDAGTRAARHAARGRLLRPAARAARPRRDASPTPSAPAATWIESTAQRRHVRRLPRRLPVPAAARAARR